MSNKSVNNSTFIRVSKNKENPYIILNKSALNDRSLSWKAKGLHSYLLGLPDDWEIYETYLAKVSTDGRDSVRSGLQELIDGGYMERNIVRNKGGTFAGYEYVVYEVSNRGKVTVVGKSDNGLSDNGLSDVGESNTTNKGLILNNDSTNTSSYNSKKKQEEKPPVPFKKIMELYNSTCAEVGYSRIVAMNGKRETQTRARFNEFGFEGFETAFDHMCNSEFLKTGGNTDWKGANYDWAIAPTNFQKLVERFYSEKETKAKEELPEDKTKSALDLIAEMQEG